MSPHRHRRQFRPRLECTVRTRRFVAPAGWNFRIRNDRSHSTARSRWGGERPVLFVAGQDIMSALFRFLVPIYDLGALRRFQSMEGLCYRTKGPSFMAASSAWDTAHTVPPSVCMVNSKGSPTLTPWRRNASATSVALALSWAS